MELVLFWFLLVFLAGIFAIIRLVVLFVQESKAKKKNKENEFEPEEIDYVQGDMYVFSNEYGWVFIPKDFE